MKKIIFALTVIFSVSIFATPNEIIMIRHADKWVQKNPGQFLSPKGQLRAEKFASYYLKNFPKPDFIFATKPAGPASGDSSSVRPLQTIAPLANQLARNNPKGYQVNFHYENSQYPALAKLLLHHKLYDNKIILICWHHGRINKLARALGVTEKLQHWAGQNYDSVYVLKYDTNGKLKSFQDLKNQYPVSADRVQWRE